MSEGMSLTAKPSFEANFDGLVGPTHNYSGLSFGNVASAKFAGQVSNPKAAALQGIAKMRFLHSLGIPQGFFPPQARPHLPMLHQLGFRGSLEQVITQVARTYPTLLAQCYSASSMWAANAATVSPSGDTEDGRVHFTPANLAHNFHRSLEPQNTATILKTIFPDNQYFMHHAALPAQSQFADEGAANHTRFCNSFDAQGVELFVYGRGTNENEANAQRKYPARQNLLASEAIARNHGLDPAATVYLRQSQRAIDAGVFHNDVIAVGHQNIFLYHELAYDAPEAAFASIQSTIGDTKMHFLCVREESLAIETAVQSYFFNSQIVTLPDGSVAIIAPQECAEDKPASESFRRIMEDEQNPVSAVHYVDVRESMQNGGGPACLRLRVALKGEEWAAVHAPCKASDEVFDALEQWVNRCYRDRLSPEDLADPRLAYDSMAALEELTQLLHLGSIYYFQK